MPILDIILSTFERFDNCNEAANESSEGHVAAQKDQSM